MGGDIVGAEAARDEGEHLGLASREGVREPAGRGGSPGAPGRGGAAGEPGRGGGGGGRPPGGEGRGGAGGVKMRPPARGGGDRRVVLAPPGFFGQIAGGARPQRGKDVV